MLITTSNKQATTQNNILDPESWGLQQKTSKVEGGPRFYRPRSETERSTWNEAIWNTKV